MKNTGGTAAFTSLYFAFWARPDDLDVELVGVARAARHELADRDCAPSLNFFAKASLTIATFGAAGGVAARELASGEERDAQRLEDSPAPPR